MVWKDIPFTNFDTFLMMNFSFLLTYLIEADTKALLSGHLDSSYQRTVCKQKIFRNLSSPRVSNQILDLTLCLKNNEKENQDNHI